MSLKEENERVGPLRWGRIFLVTTLLLAGTVLWLLRSAGSTTVFEVTLPGECAVVLERLRGLSVPESPRNTDAFTTLRSRDSQLFAQLPPGHYLLAIVGDGSRTTRIPFLVGWSREAIRWDLSHAPPQGFVPIPSGPFIRGPAGEVVATSRLFYGALHEVTRERYATFLRCLPAKSEDYTPFCGEAERIAFPEGCAGHGDLQGSGLVGLPERGNHPVTFVSWYDAVAFAAWLTETEGYRKFRFRLPTVPEWEKMWRGTDGRLYPWGNDFRRDPFREPADGGLRAVDSLQERASPYGILHMGGNVAEWTRDAGDPAAIHRVVLGRSWNSHADLVRHDARIADPATRRAPEIGIRLVADLIHEQR